QAGEWSVDVAEGVLDDDFSDRKWDVSIDFAYKTIDTFKRIKAEQREAKRIESEKAREVEKDRKLHEHAETALAALKGSPDCRMTGSGLRTALGCSGERGGLVVGLLLRQGRIRTIEGMTVTGADGKK